MSFMFKPHPYDDNTAINHPEISKKTQQQIAFGLEEVVNRLAYEIKSISCDNRGCIIAIDGFSSCNFEQVVQPLKEKIGQNETKVKLFDISDLYKTPEELEKQFTYNLPTNRVEDPVLLFGRLFNGDYASVFDELKIKDGITKIKELKSNGEVIIVYGMGCAFKFFRCIYDRIVYLDVTPKEVMLRAHAGKMINIGDATVRPIKELQRRFYYVDFMLASKLRGELLTKDLIDYYIASDHADTMMLIPKEGFNEIMSTMATYPFRCKPVYLEGVWGGHYIKTIRQLPDVFKNIAWSFELIPTEVSILIKVGNKVLEMPFFTFVQKKGTEIMGRRCKERFGGYFPIRFNYDDTFHSNGNMSIQVHPPKSYIMENFNELGQQDEGYYVVATGHDAKTYCGLKEGVDVNEFFKLLKKSEEKKVPIDYQNYVNAVPSVPGMQFLLPAGTIHSSGRNQVVLEIGSLTVGSYTFKLYDYLRKDLDGNLRPIHLFHGERVLDKTRTEKFVYDRLVNEPKLVRSGQGFEEYIVGEDDLVYFSTRQLKFDKQVEDDTAGDFHVLALVDGESVTVESKSDPSKRYEMRYLDIIVVPACIGRYIIRNHGDQPTVVYKVKVK